MYSSSVLALVKTLIEVPMIFVMTLCSIVPAAYPIANFVYSKMLELVVVCTLQVGRTPRRILPPPRRRAAPPVPAPPP